MWLLCYDIEDDNTRLKMAKRLERAGWERLQKSVYASGMQAKQFRFFFDKLKADFEGRLQADDKVYTWHIGDVDFTEGMMLGKKYDAKWIAGDYNVFYFGEEDLLK